MKIICECGHIQVAVADKRPYDQCGKCGLLISKSNIVLDDSEIQNNTISESEPKRANIFTKAKNFAKAVVKHTYNGFGETTPEVQQTRLSICNSCPLLITNLPMPECSSCGCPVEQKVKWPLEQCPEGKWGAESTNKPKRSTGCSSCQKGKK